MNRSKRIKVEIQQENQPFFARNGKKSYKQYSLYLVFVEFTFNHILSESNSNSNK
ncbi:MAG TPA: hypothetical protein VEX17_02045 [Bacillales bacterium]|nr:hypothetical protein [Bacillales bacterium]